MTGTLNGIAMHPPSNMENFCAYPLRMQWTRTEIKKRRIARGLTQEQLADLLNLSKRAVNNWETGKREPRGSSLRELDRVLGDGDTGDGDATLTGFTYLQLVSEQARRFADLEAENQALRAEVQTLRAETDNHPQSGRHGTFPDHLYPPQSGNRVNSDG